jgi:hypothetical protein
MIEVRNDLAASAGDVSGWTARLVDALLHAAGAVRLEPLRSTA